VQTKFFGGKPVRFSGNAAEGTDLEQVGIARAVLFLAGKMFHVEHFRLVNRLRPDEIVPRGTIIDHRSYNVTVSV
jgi:hypothetical protein